MSRSFRNGLIGGICSMPFVAAGFCLALHLQSEPGDFTYLAWTLLLYFAGALFDAVRAELDGL